MSTLQPLRDDLAHAHGLEEGFRATMHRALTDDAVLKAIDRAKFKIRYHAADTELRLAWSALLGDLRREKHYRGI